MVVGILFHRNFDELFYLKRELEKLPKGCKVLGIEPSPLAMSLKRSCREFRLRYRVCRPKNLTQLHTIQEISTAYNERDQRFVRKSDFIILYIRKGRHYGGRPADEFMNIVIKARNARVPLVIVDKEGNIIQDDR